MYEVWRWGNLAVAFLVELVALGTYAVWGWRTVDALPIRWLLALGLPILGAIVWALFAAPNARFGEPGVMLVTKIVVFGLAGLALWSLNHRSLAIGFVVLVAANLLIIHFGRLTATLPGRTVS